MSDERGEPMSAKPSRKACVHSWHYPHSIYEGRNANEVAIGRYCSKCRKREAAFASVWGPIPKQYVDMLNECGGTPKVNR